MFKLIVTFALVALTSQGDAAPQGLAAPPAPPNADIARAAAAGNFDEASRLFSDIQKEFKKYYENSIKSLSPPANFGAPSGPRNGEYYYQSEASYHSVVNNNGKVQEEQDGLGVINNNGAVTYYKPASVQS